MTDTHDAYVTIGWDELNYVRCDDCRGIIFGPTDNEFEANGIAVDHERNPPPKTPPVPEPVYPPRAMPVVIPPTRLGATWSVGEWEWQPPSTPTPPRGNRRHLRIVSQEAAASDLGERRG
jgi:hypothetical protein